MIERTIDWCNANRFLVLIAVAALVFGGIWSLNLIPLDALPDISDVQVIIHTEWMGQPPNIIEDQVTYPIVTTMLAAPHVKAVRAQTMFNDSYVFVVFEDGTDIYWARTRVLEYMQQLEGQLPTGVHPVIGPDATGAGWVYEYVLVDRSHKLSLADLRSLQDWQVALRTGNRSGRGGSRNHRRLRSPIPGQARSQPLARYGIFRCQTVIDKIRASNNEVGGRMLEMSGRRLSCSRTRLYPVLCGHREDPGCDKQRHPGADAGSGRRLIRSRYSRGCCRMERRGRSSRRHRRDALRP